MEVYVVLNETWFPKYKNEMLKGAMNNNLCSYLIALEGWRRGLTLTWYSRKVRRQGIHAPGRAFSLSSKNRTHHFYKSKGDKVSTESVRIGGNKEKTKAILEEKGVRVPKGKRFLGNSTDEEIIEYAKRIGFPLVIKPTNGYQGYGVISNIKDVDYFKRSLEHIRYSLNYLDVIVEEHIEGEEYRVFVLDGEVISALNRRPANITGNGKDTIETLIKNKNNSRKKNPRLSSCLIKVDFEVENFLQETNRTLQTIPKDKEVIFLRKISNISRGGDSIEVLDTFPEAVKMVAINALKALPQMPHGGVDIIIDKNKPIEQAGTVIEINGIPQIGSLVFPMLGTARDIPAAIIDYYFPETKKDANKHGNIFFDFREVLRPLVNKSASEVTVIPVPIDISVSMKYIVKGNVQNVGYRRWIRRQALQSDLHGYVQNRNNGDVHVVVAGSEQNVHNFIEKCKVGPLKAKVDEVLSKELTNPVKIGFEIKKSQKPKKKSRNLPKRKKVTFLQRVKGRIKRVLA